VKEVWRKKEEGGGRERGREGEREGGREGGREEVSSDTWIQKEIHVSLWQLEIT
jgi:hypothetical protein